MNERRMLMPTLLLTVAVALSAGALAATAAEPAVAPASERVEGPVVEASATVPGTGQIIHQGLSAREEATAILKGLSMMAFIDPETGALRAPTPEEAKQLAAAGQRLQSLAAQSRFEVRPFSAVSGGTAAEVPPELFSHSFAEISQNGHVQVRCSDSATAGAEVLSHPSAGEEK